MVFTETVFPQSPLDSLEIYNPFTDGGAIRRIVKTRLSILSGENRSLINNYAKQIEEAQKTNSLNIETTALIKSGDIFFKSALYNIALNYYMRALEIFEDADESTKAAFVEIKIGRTYYFSDLVPYAKEYINKAHKTLISSDDEELNAYAHYAIGTVEKNSNRAMRHFKKALEIQKRIIKKNSDDYSTNENLAKYYNATGDYEKALKIAEKIDDKWLTVLYLNNIGYDKMNEGKYIEAINIFNRSLKISKAAKLKGLLKNTYVNISNTYGLMGDWQKAAKYKDIAAFIVESLYAEEFTIQTSEMEVKYNTKRKELENELLKKEQIILADKINDKVLMNYILFISIIGTSLFSFYFYFSRKKIRVANILLDNQKNEIREQKEKLELLNEALQKSEEDLNFAQAAAHLANWEWNLMNDNISFSKELPIIYGVDEKKLKSNFMDVIFDKIHPEDRQEFHEYFYEDVNKIKNEVAEYRIIINNKFKWIRAKRFAIRDENKNVTKIFGTVQDITESKKTEQAKIKMASQQSFAKQLIQNQEDERERIAGELHDSLGQEILLIKTLAQIGLQGENLDPFTAEQLEQITSSSSEIINRVREIAFNLRPAHLERFGLTETVISLIDRVSATTQINFKREIDNIDKLLPVNAEINFFRIIQESISNIVKHSGSASAEINIHKMDQYLFVEIEDDGKGFKLKTEIESLSGFGLNNILNRVALLNGKLDLDAGSSNSSKIIIKIPYN